MNKKLDKLFSFRDKADFKGYTKGFIAATMAYFLVTIGFICRGQSIDIMMFMVIPLLLICSFLKKNDYLFIVAEIFTVAADIALMIFHYEPVGFSIYLFVQLIYGLYFFVRDTNKKRQIIISIVRPILMILGAVAAYLIMKDKFNFVLCMAVIYFVNLLINIVCAATLKDYLLLIGFTLFALSDLVIGMNMLLPETNAFRKFLNSFNFMHFFYLISQVLLMFNTHNNTYLDSK